jgi:hypothetical protein
MTTANTPTHADLREQYAEASAHDPKRTRTGSARVSAGRRSLSATL